MSVIVFDPDDKSTTARAFKYEVDALSYKNDLEEEGRIVAYLDLPSIEFRDANQIVDAIR